MNFNQLEYQDFKNLISESIYDHVFLISVRSMWRCWKFRRERKFFVFVFLIVMTYSDNHRYDNISVNQNNIAGWC